MVLRKRLFGGDSSRLSVLAMLVGAMSAACSPPAPVDAGKDGEPDSTRSDIAIETSTSDSSDDVAPSDALDSGSVSMTDVVVRADADASMDVAALPDAAASDASAASDARRTVACGPTTVVAAGATASFDLVNVVGGRDGPELPCVRGPGAQTPGTNRSQQFQIATASQVTFWHWHSLADFATYFAIAEDCAGDSPMCLAATRYPFIISQLMMPGTYELQMWGGGRATVFIEPPVAAPTNTTCSTATPLTLGAWAPIGPRVLDTNSRFFRWRPRPDGSVVSYLSWRAQTNCGSAMLIIRRGCGAGAVEIARENAEYLVERSGIGAMVVRGVAADQDYFLEISTITRGVMMEVMVN